MCNIDPALNRLVRHTISAAKSADSFFPLAGLSGKTFRITAGEQTFVARGLPEPPLPGMDRRREHRILTSLAGAGIAPRVYGVDRCWLLLEWIEGETPDAQAFAAQLPELAHLLKTLHDQPLSDFTLSLSRLLQDYWQQSRPERRHYRWYRTLKTLLQQGEPKLLRSALLHMDIHAGNLVKRGDHHLLIDWEYAGDGDVALELAAIISGNGLTAEQQRTLVSAYATLQHLAPAALHAQIARWQPWLRLLMASWYEARWQQTRAPSFLVLADNAWQQISTDKR